MIPANYTPLTRPSDTPTMRQAWRDYRKAVPFYAEIVTAPLAVLLFPAAVACRIETKVKGWLA